MLLDNTRSRPFTVDVMKSLALLRLTRVNHFFYLSMMLLGFLCLSQIYYKVGIAKMIHSSTCHSKNCDFIPQRPRKLFLPIKMFSVENTEVSLTNLTDNRIFVFDAYLIRNNEIRIITVRKCKNIKRILLRVSINETSQVLDLRSYPIHTCPWCHFVGYFVRTTITNEDLLESIKRDVLPDLSIGTDSKLENMQNLNLMDVRLKSMVGRHTLAVCLQPIFFFADWTLLIQFFETWINQGATKFYIYVQSMAPEVDELLQVYEADPDIDIERVNWAPLPQQGFKHEPNNYVYRGEVVASVNDCILRARGQAKLVVSSDLDEIIYSYGQSLISLLDNLITKHPKAAAFLFRTRMAEFQNQWADVTDPDEINFDMLSNITIETKVWPAGQRSKVIMFPELIGRAHVHSVLSVEKGHNTITLNPKTGVVLHLRRVHIKGTYSETTDYLEPLVPLYNKQWKKRRHLIGKLENLSILKRKRWPNRGLKVLKEIDACRNEMEQLKNRTCISYFKCYGNITAVDEDEWIWANQQWVAV